MAQDLYWKRYDHTLALIRTDKPTTFAGVKLILDTFTQRSSGDAFFPDGADDDLASALSDAEWSIKFSDGDYVYTAKHPATGAVLQYVEGDIYCLLEGTVAP
ncbi:hypothetical protein I6E74_06255 [Salinibacterium sp. SWN139]|uniref:hypothetical protein n=1 Tax=Salinibacterium sp. SWN139 TaxID=2792055 RepID=UPI0018CDA33B|nr:hypothetical protein [Salinibacterium sp. SWN139]MBH0053773.1 hypothetical protein [Salinibacterium sp. SWN139]